MFCVESTPENISFGVIRLVAQDLRSTERKQTRKEVV